MSDTITSNIRTDVYLQIMAVQKSLTPFEKNVFSKMTHEEKCQLASFTFQPLSYHSFKNKMTEKYDIYSLPRF